MFTSQKKSGVDDYQSLCKLVQGPSFDTLMKLLNIDIKGFKVIDIGCGTGNNSSKLSKMVGDQGQVVGIDPIKDRIQKAEEVYGTSNLIFKSGGTAKDSWHFGTNFNFYFIYLRLFTQDSLFSSAELLSMRVLPSLRNTYKGALQN